MKGRAAKGEVPAPARAGQPVRCAIYTRKSSEEGLEQGFNSLDAQYEACAAYILSQASESWAQVAERYDDGGVSGGTLERPGLKRLLADIEAGRIDIIVVYKVDRLTRSLLDFSKLVERFDQAEVSFVSITQAFNTTSSMGRLTLNMLLSFAQFEREVTAERIRDKIAASKAKGMWMGGVPPIGYRPDGRSLAIVEEDARLTRHIFSRYLELGNVRTLAEELERQRIHAPVRTLATGREVGGIPLSRGQLYKLLNNPLYLGEVHHNGSVYKGLHQPLIEREMWEQVQAKLAANTQGERRGDRQPAQALLAGRIVDEAGEKLIAVHSSRPQGSGTVRYGYYVSADLHHARAEGGMRIPAREADALVIARLGKACGDPLGLIAAAGLEVAPDEFGTVHTRMAAVAAGARLKDAALIRDLVIRVQVLASAVEIELDARALAERLGVTLAPGASGTLLLTSEVRLTRSGRSMRLIEQGGGLAHEPDPALVRLLAQARRYWLELRKGEIDVTRLASREGVSGSWLTRVLRTAFLSPRLVEAVLAGRQPAGTTTAALLGTDAVPAEWEAQSVRFKRSTA